MNTKVLEFKNRNGHILAAKMDLPVDRHPHNYAILAHCFPESGEEAASIMISNALVSKGFAVVRFDFAHQSGGADEGSKKERTAQVSDLADIAAYLERGYRYPSILIGHSIAGTAALLAAWELDRLQAVATIGAPATAVAAAKLGRTSEQKADGANENKRQEAGAVSSVDPDFIEYLKKNEPAKVLGKLRKPILLLHSPQDNQVPVENAERLYIRAFHPKSYISLDRADHLLEKPADAQYAGSVIAGWSERYLSIPESPELETGHQVVAGLGSQDGFTTLVKAGRHYFAADEPVSVGGQDFGPSPYALVSAGLASCTAMTLQMYTKRKKWPLEEVMVHVSYSKSHAADCENCEDDNARLDTFHRSIELKGPLDQKQRERCMEIANKCPVHRTLDSKIQIITELTE